MASITATHLDAPAARTGRWTRVRAACTTAVRQAAQAVSTARHRDLRSPVLTASGLGFIDISAWETFGRGAGWLALGVSVLLYDWHRD